MDRLPKHADRSRRRIYRVDRAYDHQVARLPLEQRDTAAYLAIGRDSRPDLALRHDPRPDLARRCGLTGCNRRTRHYA